MKRIFVFGTVLLLMFVVIGCGGGESDSDGDAGGAQAASLTIVQNDIYYGDEPTNADSPPVWTVPAGANVRVSLDNQGALEHNWAVVKLGEAVPDVFDSATDEGILFWDAGLVEGGAKFSEGFTAPSEAGSYAVICTVAGHYPSMQGVLEVQ